MSAPTLAGESVSVESDLAIEVVDLRRTYGRGKNSYTAVDGVSWQVHRGEIFALLGTNGAGKTSTTELVAGLGKPSGGSVRVFGHDPESERAKVRPRMGIMLQDSGFPTDLTVAEVLRMWTGTLTNPVPVAEALEMVDLVDRRDTRVKSLSGGQRRRLDLACALSGNPDVVLLDEPTTGLDPESRRATWDLIDGIRSRGAAVVLTTHYLDEAQTLADRLAIMHEGKIAVTGTVDEVVAGHRATISFRPPSQPLPQLSGVSMQFTADRVHIQATDLQATLTELLTWAAHHDVSLTSLAANAATLESVFLTISGKASQ